ncbi:S9 family peptidase [Amphibacillus cookii]|uniref:S9 family peptidase n=1 Tax=Amphibacillus cookii TaxID=767787 RepID=UPI00195C031C|nr:S9 family peptidase [Amphibacillus cookii]MBM7543092.1 dipeptidyl aminopeptidase/acylaminoacyl peptidase [Amphibacillus cookii]
MKFSFIQEPQIAPNGERAVYVKRMIDEHKKYQSHLFMIDLNTQEERSFTQGEATLQTPRFSPDGKQIAFVSKRSGKNQVWLIPVDGGEARQLTDFPNGANDPIWAPDSNSLIVTAPLRANQTVDSEKDEKDDETLTAYTTEHIKYKADGIGLLDETFKQLIHIQLSDQSTTQLTDGDFNHADPAFSPDGKQLAFVANREDDAHYLLSNDLYLLHLNSKQLTKHTNNDFRLEKPIFSPNGEKISMIGNNMEYTGATLARVLIYDLTKQTMTALTSEFDAMCQDVSSNDMGTGGPSAGAVWSKNGEHLYFLASDHGATSLYQVDFKKQVKKIFGEKEQVYQFSFNERQDQCLLSVSDPKTPGDLHVYDLHENRATRLTHANQSWLDQHTLAKPETFHCTSKDGTPLHGWIQKPLQFQKDKQYPLIVEIHGGPHMMYSFGFMHEFQVLAEKGYGVLYINPRGSHGYGQHFANANRGDYGGGDYQDIMAAVDYALEHFDWIDSERLGVTGGSYGGFMTNWIVSHSQRFKAAVTQRSISNWHSFFGVSDIGYFFTDWELQASILTDPDKLWFHSPIRYVNQIETPLLILHSEEDHRCPIEQAEQLYVALKMRKKTTRLVRFPKSNHGLSRNGEPSLRIERLNEMTNWFDRYLL